MHHHRATSLLLQVHRQPISHSFQPGQQLASVDHCALSAQQQQLHLCTDMLHDSQQQQATSSQHRFCFRYTGNPSLTASNLANSWPVLTTVLSQHSSNSRIVEKTGHAIKQALQVAGTKSAGLLQQVIQTVAHQFSVSGHPCMLYIASELLKTYGQDAQYQAALGENLLHSTCGV